MAELSRVRGFSFNGVNIDNMTATNLFLLNVKKTAVAQRNYTEFDLPNKDGAYFKAHKYNVKNITVTIGVYSASVTERRLLERNFLNHVTGVKDRLIFLDEPDKYYEAEVFEAIERTEEDVWTKVDINFTCSPCMYELFNDLRDYKINNYQVTADDTGKLINTMSWQNVISEFSTTVVNNGNYKSLPVIYFYGSAKIINFRVNDTVFSFSNLDGFVYIDCEKMTVYTITYNKKKSLLTNFTGAFPTIETGQNAVAVSGSNLNLSEIQLNFSNTYIV